MDKKTDTEFRKIVSSVDKDNYDINFRKANSYFKINNRETFWKDFVEHILIPNNC